MSEFLNPKELDEIDCFIISTDTNPYLTDCA